MRRLDFLHYIMSETCIIKKMSRLQKSPAPTMIEPETFEEIEEEVQYSPQHPTLAFHAELKARITPDHLENYVEVQPFEDK